MLKFINKSSLDRIDSIAFRENTPYSHMVVDNFFIPEIAEELSESFPAYESEYWHVYKNAVEEKKTMNTWNHFDPLQYKVFSELNSDEFIGSLKKLVDGRLFPDHGLHGGGLHIHSNGGNLNPHLDYSIHPKMNLQRKINLIIYLEKEFKETYGGHLGLWSSKDPGQPGKLVKEIVPLFNRAVIFDTTQNSWHGMSRKLTLPREKCRKSFAAYYLQDPAINAAQRTRTLLKNKDDNATIHSFLKQSLASRAEEFR